VRDVAFSPISILQHTEDEGPGLLGHVLRERGLEMRVTRAFLGETVPASIEGCSALVILGGPMGVYETRAYPWLEDEIALVRSALRARVPVLGICLGSQLLAASLGAEVAPSGGLELGFAPVTLSAQAASDPLFAQIPSTFEPLHWHGDVFTLPEGATPLARSARTEHQAFRHGSAWGVLFHLECTGEQIAAMCRAFPEDVTRAGLSEERLLTESLTRLSRLEGPARAFFEAFVDRVQGASESPRQRES
jgi:GMP synthase (glutamine-hydrolysing)